MSYPPPPGLKSSSLNPSASLPARPPPSAVNPASAFKPASSNGPPKPAFTAFAPRTVASASNQRTNPPAHYSAPPITSYSSTPSYSYPQPESYPQSQPQQYESYGASPQIRNPFVPTADSSSTSGNQFGAQSSYDPDYEAQIQQWQSAYTSKEGEKFRPPGVSAVAAAAAAAAAVAGPRLDTSTPANKDNNTNAAAAAAAKTVQRNGGGTTWADSTLLEWDPAHFRIFVGNLAGEVTDESLLKAFSKFPSVQKGRVIREKRTGKSKGYGFVSFSDGDDYFQAAREMQGKYIGSHPVLIKRSTTEVKPTNQSNREKFGKHKGKGGGGGGAGAGGHNKVDHGGVNKKQTKTKGGMKILG